MIPKELIKTLRKLEIASTKLANEQQLTGNYSSAIQGQGLAFREVRKYFPGDDVRAIDWNVSARMDETFMKVFTEEREMTVMLVIDVSHSSLFGSTTKDKARLGIELAAACAFSAAAHGDRVGLIAVSDQVEKVVAPARGRKHALRVVREILEAKPKRKGTDLSVGLETLLHVAKRRSVVFLISDFFTDNYERTLAQVAARHDLIPMVLSDQRDRILPNIGLVEFEDFESSETVLVDTGSAQVREHYQRDAEERSEKALTQFKRLGLDFLQADTDKPYLRELRSLFARRAKKVHR